MASCPNCGAPVTGAECPYCGTFHEIKAELAIGKVANVSLEVDGVVMEFRLLVSRFDMGCQQQTVFRDWRGNAIASTFSAPEVTIGGTAVAEGGVYMVGRSLVG